MIKCYIIVILSFILTADSIGAKEESRGLFQQKLCWTCRTSNQAIKGFVFVYYILLIELYCFQSKVLILQQALKAIKELDENETGTQHWHYLLSRMIPELVLFFKLIHNIS